MMREIIKESLKVIVTIIVDEDDNQDDAREILVGAVQSASV